jgi:hypothetical protein
LVPLETKWRDFSFFTKNRKSGLTEIDRPI